MENLGLREGVKFPILILYPYLFERMHNWNID